MSCPEEISNMWEMVQDSLRQELSSTAFDLWFGSLSIVAFHPEKPEIVFLTDSEFKRSHMQKKYAGLLEKRFLDVAGMVITVTFEAAPVPPEIQRATGNFLREISNKAKSGRIVEEYRDGEAPEGDAAAALRSQYTFDNFVVGESNKFARAVCWGVATNPSRDYNPLFLFGPSGVGKTHLMYAVINEMQRANPGIVAIYTNGEKFINYMIESLSRNDMHSFREHYRSCDVLLIDDIQFIAGKQGLQEEFFHTFQSLFDEGKQIILASDRPPKDINPLESRLRSRFEQGLLADINPPDLELRTSIIKKKAESCGITLPPEVLTFLAENLRSNVRQLEGAIRRLAAKNLLEGRPISMQLARDCASDMMGDSEPLEVTIEKIFAAVSRKYNVPIDDIKSKKRNAEIAQARHVASYLVWKITEISLPHIGKIFGRDHTTVLSSLNVVKNRIPQDPIFESDLEALEKEVTGK